ncbi:MAG: helix-hairpin-helix domain-containing protein [Planctomycetes bacterium]|jgi:hypothetical protein|nr:helix-hairpin-helix domain-containing protein [Planctomycetota bacterium]
MVGHERYSINEASKDELTQIPGIDEATAQAILDFRERPGWIHNLEELGDLGQIDQREMHELREWYRGVGTLGILGLRGPEARAGHRLSCGRARNTPSA